MTILFLDFDGVLHPLYPRRSCSAAENKLFSYLPHLEGVLRDFPEWKIVISSSWRENLPWEKIIQPFSPDIAARIIGATPVLRFKEPPYPRHPRYNEILDFLAKNGHQTTRWVALDDDAALFPAGCPNLILCEDGFKAREAAILRDLQI